MSYSDINHSSTLVTALEFSDWYVEREKWTETDDDGKIVEVQGQKVLTLVFNHGMLTDRGFDALVVNDNESVSKAKARIIRESITELDFVYSGNKLEKISFDPSVGLKIRCKLDKKDEIGDALAMKLARQVVSVLDALVKPTAKVKGKREKVHNKGYFNRR